MAVAEAPSQGAAAPLARRPPGQEGWLAALRDDGEEVGVHDDSDSDGEVGESVRDKPKADGECADGGPSGELEGFGGVESEEEHSSVKADPQEKEHERDVEAVGASSTTRWRKAGRRTRGC